MFGSTQAQGQHAGAMDGVYPPTHSLRMAKWPNCHTPLLPHPSLCPSFSSSIIAISHATDMAMSPYLTCLHQPAHYSPPLFFLQARAETNAASRARGAPRGALKGSRAKAAAKVRGRVGLDQGEGQRLRQTESG